MEFADEFEASVEDENPDSSHSPLTLVVPVSDSEWSLVYHMNPGKGGDQTIVETQYHPLGDFKFTIYPEKWSDGFAKLLGMQDIVVGHEDFDKQFIIKGNDEQRIKDLFQDAALRRLLMDEPTMQFWAHCENTESTPTRRALHTAQNRLAMRVKGAVDDFERLKSFYNLKHRALSSLIRIGAASG